jgi:hypothetical protein
MVDLLLGPMLRHVGEDDATIWVETSAPCEVEIWAGGTRGRERTFHVGGHHYAIVVLTGLEPASSTEYLVRLDGQVVWPAPDSPFPPSRIRTVDGSRPIRLIFGSCREAPRSGGFRHRDDRADVLDAYATRMLSQHHERWPELMLFVGDQVYADDTSAAMQEFIKSRRDIRKPPQAEVADFEEYTRLYLETWSEPKMRWLLSTMPTSMIFDDHDVRDDWNTSHAWRLDMQKQPWWDRRITGALMSYWIYQHLGNLSPAGLQADETYRAVRDVADAEDTLRDFARAADREADGAKGAMWSYRRDFGPVRLLVIDSRCGRILGDGRRSMISDAEFEWVERQTEDGPYEHLVVVSSMPWLLPRALHGIESWNEALAGGSRGRLLGRVAEWIRRLIDLEHWAAFRESFDRLAVVFGQVGRGERATPAPSTIVVLSGDVHHTYVSEADYPVALKTRVFQITCSPIQNTIPRPMRFVFSVSWSRMVERGVRVLDRLTRVPSLPIAWHHPSGPHFGNMLASVTFDGRSARAQFERAVARDLHAAMTDPTNLDLEVVDEVELATAGAAGDGSGAGRRR